ncbi:hypothetical protein ACEN2J_17295 [Pseudorhodobacter sp. W20_MBD10_FR17]|uniref:hypothetical protein n=1 Tax=Pseudorhodobacter sp. W20_MBD10_FR17 TaxID=3240266 RepID=UPI003F99DF96
MTNTQTALAGLFDGLTQTAQADLQTQTIETLFAEWVGEFDRIAATDARGGLLGAPAARLPRFLGIDQVRDRPRGA